MEPGYNINHKMLVFIIRLSMKFPFSRDYNKIFFNKEPPNVIYTCLPFLEFFQGNFFLASLCAFVIVGKHNIIL